LHHQLRKAEAAHECRFAAGIRPGDDDEILAVGIKFVADDLATRA
jgi:hypothetical protein